MAYHVIQGNRLIPVKPPTANAAAAMQRRLFTAVSQISGATLLARLTAPQLAAVQADAAKQAAAGAPTLAKWLITASAPGAMVAIGSPATRIVARVLVANGALTAAVAKTVFAP